MHEQALLVDWVLHSDQLHSKCELGTAIKGHLVMLKWLRWGSTPSTYRASRSHNEKLPSGAAPMESGPGAVMIGAVGKGAGTGALAGTPAVGAGARPAGACAGAAGSAGGRLAGDARDPALPLIGPVKGAR